MVKKGYKKYDRSKLKRLNLPNTRMKVNSFHDREHGVSF